MSSQEETLFRHRVTYPQLESLWEFLNSHKDIAVGYNKSAQAREYAKRMWVSIAEALNSHGQGATKDWKGWSNYWVDYKAKLKRRIAAIRLYHLQTGGGVSKVIPLNVIEKKFLGILGDDFGTGLPGTQVDPFPNLGTETEPLETLGSAGTSQIEPEPVAGPCTVASVMNDQHTGTGCSGTNEIVVVPLPQEEAARTTTTHTRNWRRRRPTRITQDEARKSLVETAKARLELEQQNSSLTANCQKPRKNLGSVANYVEDSRQNCCHFG